MTIKYPKLRSNIEAIPLEKDGQQFICLRDPQNYADKTLLIPWQMFSLLNLLDGKHDVLDIQAEYMRRYNELIYRDQIEAIIEQLDDHLFLDSERFNEFFQRLKQEFLSSSLRKSLHAGSSYPEDPEALRELISSFFDSPEGPGPIEREGIGDKKINGIIAPHIDLRFGGPCFAWAYKELARYPVPDLFIILGTAHAATENIFVLTKKDFETPLGVVKTDQEFIDELAKRCRRDLFIDELVHRNEHTVEFQLLFLQYLYPEGTGKIKIVPVLCGSFHEMILSGTPPREVEQVKEFIEAMRTTLMQRRVSACLIASADLAHIGLRYGDPSPPSATYLQTVSQEDLSMLEFAARGDPEGFFQSIHKDRDRRRICGFPPIYTMLSLLDPNSQGTLLKYVQWTDPTGYSTVTFASMVFLTD